NTPEAIFRFLREIGCDQYDFFVCEHLIGHDTNPVSVSEPSDIPDDLSPLNIVVLKRREDVEKPQFPRPGIPNEFFVPEDDSMVSREHLRWIDLGLLEVSGEETVWEIGAATGSVSIESARLNPEARYYAIEEQEERFHNLCENIRTLETFNVIPVNEWASQVLEELPDPDRIFLGGSEGELDVILPMIDSRLSKGGVVIANFITMENLNETRQFFQQRDYEVNMLQVSLHESRPLAHYTRWEEGPVLQNVKAVKK
ncbi:MAG: precorrin-6Y C5,15-methyltransferase (decarboxylating) subunit CbiT, partial [bacterium]